MLISLLSAVSLLAVLPAPSGGRTDAAPAAQSGEVIIEGTYLDETGAPIVVSTSEGQTRLESGPSTFTLVPVSTNQFSIPDRNLTVTFAFDEVRIAEGSQVVAKGKKGAATPTVPSYQAQALPAWLEANVPSLLQRYKVPAASIAFVDHGRVMWTKTYGESRKGVPADSETLFNIASLTKPITAEIILRAAASRDLDIDAAMSPVYSDPDLAGDERVNLLTPRMALLHRTGLPNWRGQTGNLLKFVSEPGAKFRYSGEGYTYAAHYAERITGQPFEKLASRLLFKPLKMTNTHYTFVSAYKDHAARPHDALGREIWPLLRLEYSGACCMYSTASDYAKFMAAVMEGRGLPPALRSERFRRDPARKSELCVTDGGLPADICPPYGALGLGWFVYGFDAETVITHTGINDGERSSVFFVPEKKFGLVILTNGANGAKLIRDITHAAYDNQGYLKIVDSFAQ